MKKVILGSLLTAAIVLTGTVQAKVIDKYTEAKLINVCKALKSNSKIKLNFAIENSGISVRAINKGLVCNGQDPVNFAMSHNAQKTAEFMASKSGTDHTSQLAKL